MLDFTEWALEGRIKREVIVCVASKHFGQEAYFWICMEQAGGFD